jgi:hypothetical protein
VFVNGDQSTGRAVTHLLEKLRSHLGIIGVVHLIPDLAVWIAKARERAQDLGISESHRRPFDHLRLLRDGLSTGSFGPVEIDLGMRAIAERFLVGISAAAECILHGCRESITLNPLSRLARGVDSDCLKPE